MKTKQTTLIIGIIVLVIIAAAIVVTSGKKKNDTMSVKPPSSAASSNAAVDSSQAVATASVTLENYAFSPATIKVKVGTTVNWTNKDTVHHSVVGDNSGLPNGPLFGQGETYKYTFTKAGTFTYHCAPHPYMHGSVVVTD